MPFDRAAARKAGYSDVQIDAYIRSQPDLAAEADATRRAASTPGFMHSVSRGATFNLSDRLDGLMAMGETALTNLGPNKVTYSPQQAYEAVVRANQAAAAQYAKDHPVRDLAGTVVGGIYAPGAKALGNVAMRGVGEAATLGQKAVVAARSGVAGGMLGAAYGAGGADPGQMLPGAAHGAVTGFALGAVTPTAVAGLERGLKYAGRVGSNAAAAAARAYPAGNNTASRVAAQVARTFEPALTNPELRAASGLQAAIERDAVGGVQINPDVAPMFQQGRNLQGIYDVVAASPGAGSTMISRAAKAAADASHDGIKADLGTHLGGAGDYWAKLDALLATRRANAQAGMAQIGDHLVTLTNDSTQALRSDLSRGALKEAAGNGLASTDEAVRAGAANLNRLADAVFDKPSAQTITVREAQDISESLLSAADAAYRAGNNAKGKALKGLGKAVRENARKPDLGGFQEYDDFLKQYASDSEAKRAFDLGADALTGGLRNSPEKVMKELQGMGADAWEHYRKGVGEGLYNKVGEAGGDLQVMRKLLRSDNFSKRVQAAFRNPQDFEQFLAATEQRVLEANLSNRYLNQSATYGRGAAAEALYQDGADVLGVVGDALSGNAAGLSQKALKALIKGAGDGRMESALKNPRSNAALGRSASDPAELQALLKRLEDYRRLNAAPKLGGRAAVVAGSAQANRRP